MLPFAPDHDEPGPPARGVDPDLDTVSDWFDAQPNVQRRFGAAVRQALDEVIDTARTRRWSLDQCNTQEQAYLGVKLEHIIRAEFDLADGPGSGHPDYTVDGVGVDCKWSRHFGGWQIPPEAIGDICLVVWGDDATCGLAAGLIRITEPILVGGNRDGKRTIQSPGGRATIRWIVPKATDLPENFLFHLSDDNILLSDVLPDEVFREMVEPMTARQLFAWLRLSGQDGGPRSTLTELANMTGIGRETIRKNYVQAQQIVDDYLEPIRDRYRHRVDQ